MNRSLKNKITNLISLTDIGKHFGISSQAVGKWLLKGGIPSERVLSLCELLDWAVTPHGLRPDIYPNPTDGLPTNKQTLMGRRNAAV
ncbi:transcriptional regulator [Yersinia enterocolitica]|uniref:transcriptional regulator n=1 Tax=Yersinia enterocolitica TaxID=630 RepID=UPI003AB6A117